ncbi:gamma-glutamylputrescine oxidoreductase, partial [Psychrobacter proteolyticus]
SNNTRNIPHYSDKGQYTDIYYAASRNPKPDRTTLKNDIQVEICVVGCGYSGLSTAIHLVETDHEDVVL